MATLLRTPSITASSICCCCCCCCCSVQCLNTRTTLLALPLFAPRWLSEGPWTVKLIKYYKRCPRQIELKDINKFVHRHVKIILRPMPWAKKCHFYCYTIFSCSLSKIKAYDTCTFTGVVYSLYTARTDVKMYLLVVSFSFLNLNIIFWNIYE